MINVAVAGIGVWGRNIVRNFYEIKEANLLFCYDSNPACLRWIKDNYSGVNITDDYQEILTNKKINAIIIATPAYTHFELARRALDAGKNVLVEKPLTLNSKEAAELVAVSRKKGRILMVGHLLKYHPAVLEMRKRIRSGELGKIFYIHSQRLGLGRVREVENVMWCLGIHDIYTAVYLLGEYPGMVGAVGESFLQKSKGIEDVILLSLFFSDGVFAHIHVSWVDPQKFRRTTVIGEKKMMLFDELLPPPRLKIYDKGIDVEQNKGGISLKMREGDESGILIEDKQPLREECLHFIRCVREGRAPFTDGEEGLRIIRILEAAQRSLKQGSPVKI